MADIFEANGLVGDAVNPYQQTYADTCAIKSQQIILNEFGIPATEDQLVQYSYEKGWYHGDGSGTTMQDVGNLLEDANIPCTRQANANVFNLVSELSQGHKVIVGVDSGELWGNKFSAWYNDFFNGDTPDHALIVSGIDTSDPNNVQVIVTDPGNGDYHKAYPLDQFMDAWSDASCYMVSTDIAVPDVVNGMQNFNYDAGHIDSVAGMDYTDFQIFNDLSYGLPVYGLNGMGTYDFPVSSLMDAYWGVANNDIMFGDIFSGYAFNDYLDVDIAAQMMHCSEGYKILGHRSGIECGGKYFDAALYKHFNSSKTIEYSDDDNLRMLQVDALSKMCRDIKETLSENDSVSYPIPILKGQTFDILRTEFEDLISPLLEKTFQECQALIHSAGKQWSDINRILLIGGSCAIPCVKRLFEQYLVGQNAQVPIIQNKSEEGIFIDALFAVSLGGIIYIRDKESQNVLPSNLNKYSPVRSY